MAKEKSLVDEAIIQMKNLEEAVAENAKGILNSVMKEEIKDLVKESLSEQELPTGEEDEIGLVDVDMNDLSGDDSEDEDETEEEEFIDADEEGSDELDNMEIDEPIDLTDKSDEEVLRVFQLMGPDDNIIVKKDDAGNISLKDSEKEYMIVGEGEEEEFVMDEEEEFEDEFEDEEFTESVDDIVSKVFDNDENWGSKKHEYKRHDGHETGDVDGHYKDYELGEDEDEDDIEYEIEYEDSEDDEFNETYESSVNESKTTIKPKGIGMGKPKFKYDSKPNQKEGFKTKMKQGTKGVGMGKGKPKFEYDEEVNMDGKMKPVKKVETKESSRTLGNGSNFRKGGLPKPRAHSKANTAIKEDTNGSELQILREKNEEYRKALNVFRDKLNEVAVFNSNLAYATRLFTEHSTSKQEKINILRRFDSVDSIKESKNLYQSIKEELSTTTSKPVNESIERVIAKAPSTGSAVNLIESKTYENPQFLRMKDLMTKIK